MSCEIFEMAPLNVSILHELAHTNKAEITSNFIVIFVEILHR